MPASADSAHHDAHRPARSSQSADRIPDLKRADLSLEPFEPRRTGLHLACHQVALDVVIISKPAHVLFGALRKLVEKAGELFGLGKTGASGFCPLLGISDVLRLQQGLLDEPVEQIGDHTSRRGDDRAGGSDLADHEVAHEGSNLTRNLVRAEESAVSVLVARVESALPALAVERRKALVCTAVDAVLEEVDDGLVVPQLLAGKPFASLCQIATEQVIDPVARLPDRL